MQNPTPPPRPRRGPLLAALACGLALALAAWLQRPDGQLHVHVLAAPGDAVLIQTPAGRFALIDGGADPAQLALLLGRHMPFWRRDLLAAVLTEGGHRRIAGHLAALARYRPKLALAPPGLGRGAAAGEYRRLLAAAAAPARELRAGQRLDLDGATLTVLAAAPGDDGGAVLLLTYGATRVLLHTGGPAGDRAALRAAARPVDLLVYPWQRPLATPAVAALRPRAIVFTAAHEAADPALLTYADRLRHSPQVYHPANEGTVTLSSDGRRALVMTSGPQQR
jgi:hypothetical protein